MISRVVFPEPELYGRNKGGFYAGPWPTLRAFLCFHLCAHVRDYDNYEDDYFTFSSSAPLRRSKGRRGRMKDRREKTTEEDMEFVCLYVCVRV